MPVERIGDWRRASQLILAGGGLARKIEVALLVAHRKNALFLVAEIKKGIRSQSPGGKPFARLADSTIKKKKGSTKALIDDGFLINSVTHLLKGDVAFVGLLKTATNRDGDSLANIGAIMEFGATINMPNGGIIIIPPRPFIHPVMQFYRVKVKKNYIEAVRSVLNA